MGFIEKTAFHRENGPPWKKPLTKVRALMDDRDLGDDGDDNDEDEEKEEKRDEVH